MASKIVVDTSDFESAFNDFITRLKGATPEAARIGMEAMISEAMANAPSPAEEAVLMNRSSYSPIFARDNSEKEAARRRFFHADGTYPVQVALAMPDVWTLTDDGFSGPNMLILDELTRFSWTNASRDRKSKSVVTYTYTSDHGTFIPLEFGLVYEVYPKNGSDNSRIHLLSPVAGEYALSAVKSVPALDIIRRIDPQVILDAMASELSSVEF